MISFFIKGGFFMWPLLILAISIIILSIKKIIDLFIKKDLNHAELESGINAIIFWGGISALIGFFAHYMGLFMAMMAICRAHDISPAIVSRGYAVSLITVLTGLLILIISSIIWFVLRWRYKKMVAEHK